MFFEAGIECTSCIADVEFGAFSTTNHIYDVITLAIEIFGNIHGAFRSLVQIMGHLFWLPHGVDPLSYFSFQPVLHDWRNKGRGMCYPVCGMVHIKEPLLLINE